MQQPVEDAPAEPPTPAGAVGDAGRQARVRGLVDLARFRLPNRPAEPGADAPQELEVAEPHPAGTGEQTAAEDVVPHPGTADLARAEAATSGDGAALLEAVEGQTGDRPAPGRPEPGGPEREAAAGSGVEPPEPLLAAPAETSLPETRSGEQVDEPPPHGSEPTASLSDGGEATPPSPPRDDASALGVASPQRGREPAVAKGARDGHAMDPLDGSGSAALRRHNRLSAARQGVSAFASRQTDEPAFDADRGGEPASIEKPAGQNSGREFIGRIEEAGPKQQLPGDLQIARLANSPGLQGAGGAPAPLTSGSLTDSALVIARGPDAMVDVEAPMRSGQVALQITKSLDQDKTSIRIELDPRELGEVDIDLEFHDLRLTATVRAERSDVLDLLQRDVRTLARALREAGVEVADSDIAFAQGGRDDHGGYGAGAQRAIGLPGASAETSSFPDLPVSFEGLEGFVSVRDGRMDLRV